MEIFLIILLFILGIILIVKGGDFFVDAAAWIAEVSGIPKLIIGATIVSIATTLPEMIVSTIAAVEGKVDMSISNAVGSVTANIGLIMAISLLFMPAAVRRRDYLAKSVLMLLSAALIVVSGFIGKVNFMFAAMLIVVFGVFVFENIKAAKAGSAEQEPAEKPEFTKKILIVNILKFLSGAAGIVIGARLLVDNGSELARLMGISERIIGVTMVAIGTSLPELVTTITAIVKKQSSLSVGNILGANILDLTLILPIASFASGKALPISVSSSRIDLPFCLIVALIAVVPMLITSKFKRWQGAALLVVYVGYMVLTCTYGATL